MSCNECKDNHGAGKWRLCLCKCHKTFYVHKIQELTEKSHCKKCGKECEHGLCSRECQNTKKVKRK